jgi:hypothetical protein
MPLLVPISVGELFDKISILELKETTIADPARRANVARERAAQFDDRFVEPARSVYRDNDRRALVKRRIKELTGSDIVEEKSYL